MFRGAYGLARAVGNLPKARLSRRDIKRPLVEPSVGVSTQFEFRFGFVLTRNGFKFETKVNNMIIDYIVTLKIDYNPKRVIFLNWANFVIFKKFRDSRCNFHSQESVSN